MNVKYPFHKMEVGDGVMINVKTPHLRYRVENAARKWGKNNGGRKFQIKNFACGIRVRRVA